MVVLGVGAISYERGTPVTKKEKMGGDCTHSFDAPYALTPNTVELIPTPGALPAPRRARPGPGPHTLRRSAPAGSADFLKLT